MNLGKFGNTRKSRVEAFYRAVTIYRGQNYLHIATLLWPHRLSSHHPSQFDYKVQQKNHLLCHFNSAAFFEVLSIKDLPRHLCTFVAIGNYG